MRNPYRPVAVLAAIVALCAATARAVKLAIQCDTGQRR